MTTTRYKLTSPEHTTHGGYALPVLPDDGSPSEWFYPARRDEPPRECSDTALHHYAHPRLAVLFNPIHANIADPVLYEIEIDAEAGTDGLKGWCGAQRLVRRLPLPVITTEQRVEFAIRAAATQTDDPAWHEWARRWLSGEDRSEAAARAAESAAAESAARAAESAAAESAAAESAARAAAWAARAAAVAARAAAVAAESAESAARAAAVAARAAAVAAAVAAESAARAAAVAAVAAAVAAVAEAAAGERPDFLSIITEVLEK